MCLSLCCRYERIYEEVQALEPVHVFHRWMKVDGRSMRSALLNIIKKWSFMFKQHLVDFVTNRYHMQSLTPEFIPHSVQLVSLCLYDGPSCP